MMPMNRGSNVVSWLSRIVPWGLCAVLVLLMSRRGILPPDSTDSNGESAIHHERAEGELHQKLNEKEIDKEWELAAPFLKENSPRRYEWITKNNIPHEYLKRFLIVRWRMLQHLKSERQMELYDTKVREMFVEDKVFAICSQLKRGIGNKQQLETELNSQISELFDLGLKERGLRINIVKNELQVQERSLDADKSNKEQLIKERVESVKREGVEGARFGARATGQKSKPGSSTVPSPGEPESNSDEK